MRLPFVGLVALTLSLSGITVAAKAPPVPVKPLTSVRVMPLKSGDPCLSPAYAKRCADDHAEMAALAGEAVPTALPQDLPDVIQLEQYPYGKSQYDARNEWLTKFYSAQGHFFINGMLAHLHTECGGPIYGRLSRLLAFTLPCRAQLFHFPGRVEIGYGNYSEIVWEQPSPRLGNPTGLAIYNFAALLDPNPKLGTGVVVAPRPENGWFNSAIALLGYFDTGDFSQNVELYLPFFSVGNPNIPVTPGSPLLSARTMLFATPGGPGVGHGQAIINCWDYLPVLAPVTTTITVNCQSYVYAREREGIWPGRAFDAQQQLDDLDLHNGNPGTQVTKILDSQTQDLAVVFNPFVRPGPRKTAIVWSDNSGPGDPIQHILPNEEMWILLVTSWTADPGGTPPPPPPPPPPSACPGVFGWRFVDLSATVRDFIRIFTKAPDAPSNCVMPSVPSGG